MKSDADGLFAPWPDAVGGRIMQIALRLVLVICCAVAGVNVGPAYAEKRVALVIGNAAYRAVAKLPNPTKDARDVAASLRGLGFSEVIERYDLGVQGMRTALAAFEDKATGADWALVYYAGHGIEVDGRNFLIPVDAELKRVTDVEDETLALDRVLARVAAAGKLQLIILDACRFNPFKQRMAGAGTRLVGERGLARIEPSHPNVIIAYAARDGQVALDGKPGDNSPYAKALLKYLAEPGLEVGKFFRRVRDDVLAETNGKQRPFEYGSLTGQDLFFKPGTVTGVSPAIQPSLSEAAEAWDRTKDTTSIALLEAFITRYKDTFYADLARARLEVLRRVAIVAPPAQPPTPPPTPVVPAVGVFPAPSPTRCDGVETLVGSQRRCLKPKDSFKDCPECPEMVVVPAGEFMMGSPSGEEGRRGDESPLHNVRFAKPFAVSQFVVTRREFEAFVRETNHETGDKCLTYEDGKWQERAGRSFRNPGFAQDDRHPVVCVNWNDAKAFISWLSKKTDKPYRQLTESEREYITRAGTSTPFWSGSLILWSEANYDFKHPYGGLTAPLAPPRVAEGTVAVDHFKANPWGFYNVHGNVKEWVEDCWQHNYQGAPANGSAWTTGDCGFRVLRGGSWLYGPKWQRAAQRSKSNSQHRGFDFGFRLARTLSP